MSQKVETMEERGAEMIVTGLGSEDSIAENSIAKSITLGCEVRAARAMCLDACNRHTYLQQPEFLE